jgi:hypothetical protein
LRESRVTEEPRSFHWRKGLHLRESRAAAAAAAAFAQGPVESPGPATPAF